MNTIGRKFRVSIFGESHGELIGVTLDGVPAGLVLSEQDFTEDILRRKSGAKGTTPRIEADQPMIVSGVFEGHTTGAPLTILSRSVVWLFSHATMLCHVDSDKTFPSRDL